MGAQTINHTTGTGNGDALVWTDGAHLAPRGHYLFGYRAAQKYLSFWRGSIV